MEYVEYNHTEFIKLVRETTDLAQRFSSEEAEVYRDDFDSFCSDTIHNEAEPVHSIDVAFFYYNDVECYTVDVMEYQGIFYVDLGPERDSIGYFFKKNDAVKYAESFASEVYDEDAEIEYKRMYNENR